MIVEALGWALEPTPWMNQAACAGTHPDTWFPGRGQNLGPAKAVCNRCPVRQRCLDYALRWDIRFGVWGGLSQKERRRITPPSRAQRIPAAHGTTTRYARGCRCDGCTQASHEYQPV